MKPLSMGERVQSMEELTVSEVDRRLVQLRVEWKRQVIPSSAQEVMDVIDLHLDIRSDLTDTPPATWPTFLEGTR